jgi:hypothetical protein
MISAYYRRLALLALVSALSLNGCGRSAQEDVTTAHRDSAGILHYIPADTPYVLAATQRLPDDVREKIEQIYGGLVLEAARESLLKGLDDAASASDTTSGSDTASGADTDVARGRSVTEALADMMTLEGLTEAGLGLGNPGAIYGVGLVPVIRVEVVDADKVEATIARLEEEAEAPMARADAHGLAYRYAGDDEGRLLLALHGQHLVMAAVPAELTEDQIAAVLGAEPPAQSIAQAGHLAALAERYGFTPYLSGYLDVQRIAAIASEAPTDMDAAVLGGAAQAEDFSTACKQELREMADVVPRIVGGYTEVSSERFAGNVVVELREDLAKGLTGLQAAVPGLGTDPGGFVAFGVGLDLMATRDFYEAQRRAITADASDCEPFAEVQASLENGGASQQLPIPPVAYGIKGFLAVVNRLEGMDVSTGRPPADVDMSLLVASGNAPALVALGALFSPEIAAMELKPDGQARAVSLPPLGQPFTSATIALTETALGVAVGADAEAGVESLIAAAPGDPPPILSVHMDMARYYELMADALATPPRRRRG